MADARVDALGSKPRFLAVDGLTNFRDLGGYPVADGRRIREGVLFRSESLHAASPAGLEQLRALGLATVIDLRSAVEVERSPGPFESVQVEIQEQVSTSERFGVFSLVGKMAGETLLRDLYIDMLTGAAPQFGRIYSLLAEASRLPALIHCAAGKDRTGLVVALLLRTLGVDHDVVLDDYAAPSIYPEREVRRLEFHALFVANGIEAEAAHGMLSTPRWAMAEALAWIEEQHGDVARYLLGPGGMTETQLDALRSCFVD